MVSIDEPAASRITMVHVDDPRGRWSVSAARVVRIVAMSEWGATPADVLAAFGPGPDVRCHRAVIVRDAGGCELALLAAGGLRIVDVDPADVLPLPITLTAIAPQVSAVVVSADASLSLLIEPSAVTSSGDIVGR